MDANLNARIGTAVVALPILVWLVGWGPPWSFSVTIFIVTVAALREFFAMVFPRAWKDQCLGILFGVAFSVLVFFEQQLYVTHWLGMLFLIGFSVSLWTPGELAERLNRLLFSLLGGIYAGFLLPHLILLFRQPHGRAWTLWVLAVVMIGDTVAYFVGRRFGVRKLAPEISPGKTVEGAWGYIVGAVAAGGVTASFLFVRFNWVEILMLSLIIGILGQLGDLFESWIKRVFAVKDSAQLLPGHGGLLDRLDSLIFPAVFTSTYLRVFHS
jgi:phosphatidate cytidylyltransferase